MASRIVSECRSAEWTETMDEHRPPVEKQLICRCSVARPTCEEKTTSKAVSALSRLIQKGKDNAPSRQVDDEAGAETEDEANISLAALDSLGDPSNPPRLSHTGRHARDADDPREQRSVANGELGPVVPDAKVVRPLGSGRDRPSEDGRLDQHLGQVERDPVGEDVEEIRQVDRELGRQGKGDGEVDGRDSDGEEVSRDCRRAAKSILERTHLGGQRVAKYSLRRSQGTQTWMDKPTE